MGRSKAGQRKVLDELHGILEEAKVRLSAIGSTGSTSSKDRIVEDHFCENHSTSPNEQYLEDTPNTHRLSPKPPVNEERYGFYQRDEHAAPSIHVSASTYGVTHSNPPYSWSPQQHRSPDLPSEEEISCMQSDGLHRAMVTNTQVEMTLYSSSSLTRKNHTATTGRTSAMPHELSSAIGCVRGPHETVSEPKRRHQSSDSYGGYESDEVDKSSPPLSPPPLTPIVRSNSRAPPTRMSSPPSPPHSQSCPTPVRPRVASDDELHYQSHVVEEGYGPPRSPTPSNLGRVNFTTVHMYPSVHNPAPPFAVRYIAEEQPAPAGPRSNVQNVLPTRRSESRNDKLPPDFKPIGVDPATGNPVRIRPVSGIPNQIKNIPKEYREKMRAALAGDATDGRRMPRHVTSNSLPKQSLNGFIHRNQAKLPVGVSTRGQQTHLWQFLFELLTSGDQFSHIIAWTRKKRGEFKLVQPDAVAELWGHRKNKAGMNYDKMSRAMRYYYNKDVMKKADGQRYVYYFLDNVLESMAYFKPGHMTPSPRQEQEKIPWSNIIIHKSGEPSADGTGDGSYAHQNEDFCGTPSTDYGEGSGSEDEESREDGRSYKREIEDENERPLISYSQGRYSTGKASSRHSRRSSARPYPDPLYHSQDSSPTTIVPPYSPALLSPTAMPPQVVRYSQTGQIYQGFPAGSRIVYTTPIVPSVTTAPVVPQTSHVVGQSPQIVAASSPAYAVYPPGQVILATPGQGQNVHAVRLYQ